MKDLPAREPAALTESQADCLGLAMGAALRTGEHQIAPEIAAHLRASRFQAMERHRAAVQRSPIGPAEKSRATEQPSWWKKWLAALPIAASAAGVVFMPGAVSDDGSSQQLALDLQILARPIPPNALSDPAFLHYLKRENIDLGAANPATGP